MAGEPVHGVVEGFAVANVDALGDGPGFRKVRRALGVQATSTVRKVNFGSQPPSASS